MEIKAKKNQISSDDPEPPGSDLFEIDYKFKKKTNSEKSNVRQFKKKFYPEVTPFDWNDWKWQLQHSIKDQSLIHKIIGEENYSIENLPLPMRITPYYASLLWKKGIDYPISKSVIPSSGEIKVYPEEEDDPLCEEGSEKVKGLIHRYPDRVLLLVTGTCSTYCRYCTRSRVVGKNEHLNINKAEVDAAIDYIGLHKEIRDVIVSGGDPLVLPDSTIEYILSRLRDIKHVEIIRIGTKIPVVMPQRITSNLVKILKKYHPLWMSIHFTHPDEITPEVEKACAKLANAGIPLGSQTVLLKDINDNVVTMKSLMQKLLKIRVKPYYLYQCDLIKGSRHFRTDVKKGLEIIRGLRGFTSGYAVPSYVIDAPKGGGKIPLLPEYLIDDEDGVLTMKNYSNQLYTYQNIAEESDE